MCKLMTAKELSVLMESVCVQAGYTGDLCGVDINECDSVYCGSNGECRDGLSNFTCDCHPGFNGTFCEMDIGEYIIMWESVLCGLWLRI